MSIARFMSLSLSHPKYGYYSTKKTIFNKGGDFTTSPEITQMFGEIIGVWICLAMQKYTKLRHTNLVEIGPGRGVMMADIIRSLSQLKMLSNMTIRMIESSPNLRKV